MKMTAMLLIKKYLFVLSTDTTWKESMIDRKIYAIKFLFEKGLVIVCVDRSCIYVPLLRDSYVMILSRPFRWVGFEQESSLCCRKYPGPAAPA